MCLSEEAARGRGIAAVVSSPVACLRARPDSRSELLSQELFGHPVLVTARKDGWARCTLGDSHRGWMPASTLSFDFDHLPDRAVAVRFTAVSAGAGVTLLLPLGGLVAVLGTDGPVARVALPGGRAGSVAAADLRPPGARAWSRRAFSDIVREVLGTPYLWGGRSTFGFDCSGLVQAVTSEFGIRLPRDSRDQAECGLRVRGIEDLVPLDLVFFGRGRVIDHVAIHLGGLRILHASGHVRIESLDPGSRLFRADLRGRFRWAGRTGR
jgi:cell wall-associated NlpC family hydrolase